jgi:tetratricopeptide (TPR) repeat protein
LKDNQRAAKIYRELAFWVFDMNRENVSAPTGYFEKAKALLSKEEETEETAQFYHTLARFYFLTGRLPESKELASKALALSERLGLPEVEAHAYLTLAILYPANEKEAKFQNMQKALRIGLEHNFYDVVIRSYNNLVVDSEDVKDSLKYADQALSYFEKVGYTQYKNWAKLLVASGSMNNGVLERAKTIAQEFISDPNQPRTAIREAVAIMGEVLLYQGRYKESEEYLLRFRGILEGSQDFQEDLRANVDLGVLYVEMGDFAKAKDHLTKFMGVAREKDLTSNLTYGPYIMGSLWYLIQALVGLGDMEGARLGSREAKEISEKSPTDAVLGVASAIHGTMLLTEKKFAEAEAAFEKAVTLLRNRLPLFFVARTYYDFGVACIKNGDPEKAKKALAEAAGMFKPMGNDVYLGRVQSATATVPAG